MHKSLPLTISIVIFLSCVANHLFLFHNVCPFLFNLSLKNENVLKKKGQLKAF